MATKHSKAEIIRLVESAIDDVGGTPKLNIMVRDVLVSGSPPERITAFVIVRFLESAGPFCCGEPGCYSKAFSSSGEIEMVEFLQRKMNLRHDISLTLKTEVDYAPGVKFTQHGNGGS